MSSVASPSGLKPAWHPSGCIRQAQSTILANVATTIRQFDPVGITAAGGIAPVTATTVITTGGIVGAFMGIEWTGSDGRRRVSNTWVASTPTAADPAFVIYYTMDQDICYSIQATGVLTASAIGGTFNWTAPGGSAITGLSNVALSTTVQANGGLRVIGINPGPDNALADAFPTVQVQIRKHNFGPVPATVA
jgi:hypothetical protein